MTTDWRYRVWVDFNDIDEEGDVQTLQAFANQTLFIGDRVLAVDGDGLQCHGTVKSLYRDLICIHLDEDGFK